MAYVDINGLATWVSVGTAKDQTVLLLHGGTENSDSLLETIGPGLGEHYCVAAFDRRGHGRTADTAGAFHYDTMADETIAVLEHLGAPAHLIGHSDGGDVALLVAMRRPDLVGRIVMIGANYHYTGLMPEFELTPEKPPGVYDLLAADYGERSPDGIEHFGEVFAKTITMWETEPTLTTADLAKVTVPALVLVADDDAIVSSHTCSLYESIPGAQLAIVPGASHALPIEQPDEVVRIVRRFLEATLPPATFMPLRRA